MSKYAKIKNNIVDNVIVCEDSQIGFFEGIFIKITSDTGDASIGYSYNKDHNKFISVKPYDSWILGEDLNWHSPLGDAPTTGSFEWSEEDQEWKELVSGELKENTHRWDVELQEWVPLS